MSTPKPQNRRISPGEIKPGPNCNRFNEFSFRRGNRLQGTFQLRIPQSVLNPLLVAPGGKKCTNALHHTAPHHPAQQQDAIKRPGVVSR